MTITVLCLWLVGVFALWRRTVTARKDFLELLSPVTILIGGFFWMYVIGYWTLDPLTKERYLSEAGNPQRGRLLVWRQESKHACTPWL
jgi:hypothetical protein